MSGELSVSPPRDPLLGRSLAQKYQVEALVGVGAMGRVYRARQVSLDRVVAVKVLHTVLSADEGVQQRFLREAKVASRFEHPNSLRVFDFGIEPDGVVFLVMEFLAGATLQEEIDRDAPMPVPRCVKVMGQVLSALVAAHEAGIIHRDLKPENIMLVSRLDDEGNSVETVKVTDFGIAKLISDGEGDAKLTATGLVPGTPAYMSPEQASGKTLDARSDLYACGVILFEMVTGRIPFTAESAIALVIKHIAEAPPLPSSLNPAVDPRMEAVILRALEKSPAARFPDARAMRVALRGLASEMVPVTREYDLAALGLRPGAPEEPPIPASITPARAASPATAVVAASPELDVGGATTPDLAAPYTFSPDAPAPAPVAAPAPAPRRSLLVRAWPLAALPVLALATILVVSGMKHPSASVAARVEPAPVAARVEPASSVPEVRPALPDTPEAPIAPVVAAPPVAPAAPQPVAPAQPAMPAVRVARDSTAHPPRSTPMQTQTTDAAVALTTDAGAQSPTPTVSATPEPLPTPPPAPEPVPAPSPPTPEQPAVRTLRGLRGSLGDLAVSGGVGNGAVRSRAQRATSEFAACAERLASVWGRDSVPEALSCTITVDVRDRRVDGVRVGGAPDWMHPCEAQVRAAFAGELPEAESNEYAIRLGVTLTPEH